MTYKLDGNPRTFDGRNLTENDHDTIVRIFDDAVHTAPMHSDPFKVALRAVAEVRAVAEQHGWKQGPAERLAITAGIMYGGFLTDAATFLGGQ